MTVADEVALAALPDEMRALFEAYAESVREISYGNGYDAGYASGVKDGRYMAEREMRAKEKPNV